MYRYQIYQEEQTSGVLEHQPLVVSHSENFYSEKQHIRPSFAKQVVTITNGLDKGRKYNQNKHYNPQESVTCKNNSLSL